MGFDAYEQLAVDPGAVGDVARSILETPSQPGESYADTQYRSAQQAGATARIQAIKGKQWAARGVPSYQDMQGNTKPVMDDTGSPLSKLDPRHNIAYDSTGSPKKIDFDVAGGSPVLKDPFEGLETTTDPKTGHQYKIAPGLPWRWVGTDAQTAQKAEFAREDALLSRFASLNGRKATLLEKDAIIHARKMKDARSQLKELGVADTDPVTGDPLDYDGLVAGINSQFDDLKKNDTTANAKEYFGMGGYTPEALKAQQALDLSRTAALRAAATGHAQAQSLAQLQEQHDELQRQKDFALSRMLDHETQMLRAQGVDIGGQSQPPVPQLAPSGAVQPEEIAPEAIAAARGATGAIAKDAPPITGGGVKSEGLGGDLGRSLAAGGFSLLKMAGDLWGLATGDMDNFASELGKEASENIRSTMTDKQRSMVEERTKAVKAAPDNLGKAWEFVKHTLANPRLLLTGLTEQVPQFVGPGLIGKAVKFGTGKILLKGAASEAAEKIAIRKAIQYGRGAAVGTGAAMQGADLGANQYDEMMANLAEMPATEAANIPEIAELMDRGATLDDAKLAFSLTLARKTGALAGAISLASQFLPGAQTIEKAIVGKAGKEVVGKAVTKGMIRRGVEGAAGEAVQEMVEEGGGLIGKNKLAQAVDPNRSLTEGLGETLAQAALTAGPMGAVAGAMHGSPAAPENGTQPPDATGDPAQVPPPDAGTPPATPTPYTPGPGEQNPMGAPPMEGQPIESEMAPAQGLNVPEFQPLEGQPIEESPPAAPRTPKEGGPMPEPIPFIEEELAKRGWNPDEIARMTPDERLQEAGNRPTIEQDRPTRDAVPTTDVTELENLADEVDAEYLGRTQNGMDAFQDRSTGDKFEIKVGRVNHDRLAASQRERAKARGAAPAPVESPQQFGTPMSAALDKAAGIKGQQQSQAIAKARHSRITAIATQHGVRYTGTKPNGREGFVTAGGTHFSVKAEDAVKPANVGNAAKSAASTEPVQAKPTAPPVTPPVQAKPVTPPAKPAAPVAEEAPEKKRQNELATEVQRQLREVHGDTLKALGKQTRAVVAPNTMTGRSGLITKDGIIHIDPVALDKALSVFDTQKEKDAFLERALNEEVKHAQTVAFAQSDKANLDRIIALNDTEKEIAEGLKKQRGDWEDKTLPDGTIQKGLSAEEKGHEIFRVLLQAHENPSNPQPTTESTWQLIGKFVEWLKAHVKNLSASSKKLLSDLEAWMAKRKQDVAEQPESPPKKSSFNDAAKEAFDGLFAEAPTKEQQGKNFAKWREESAIRRKALAESVDEILRAAGAEGGVLLEPKTPRSTGTKLTVTPDNGGYGKEGWRVTQWDNQGPYGHFTFESREAALRAVGGESHTKLVPGPPYFSFGPYKVVRVTKREGGILHAEAPTLQQKPIPEGKDAAFLTLATTALKDGATTPEALGKMLVDFNPAARAYSQAVWSMMAARKPELAGSPDWNMIYEGKGSEFEVPTYTVAHRAPGSVPFTEQEMSPKDIHLSEDVPNIKEKADPVTGVVPGQELSGEYDRGGGGNRIVVWQRTNGRNEVITGRHRRHLAIQNDVKAVPVQVFKESDGFTKDMAVQLDAESNIRDGQGDVSDYANYFRHSKITSDEASSRGLLARHKGRAGYAIGKNASDDLYALYRAEKIGDAKAAAIATTAPGDQALQQIGIKYALKGESAAYIVNVMKAATAGAQEKGTQIDLFGNDDSAMVEMERRADTATKMQQAVRDRINAVRGAVKRPEAAAEMGVDVKDVEGTKKEIARLEEESARWDNWPMHKDLVAKVKGEEAKPAKKAEPKKDEAEVSDEEYFGNILRTAADKPNELRVPDVDRVMSAVKPEEVEKFRAWLLDQGPFKQPGVAAEITTWTAEESPVTEYAYGMQNRPRQIGAQPKDFSRVDENDKRGRHGVIFYNRKLTADEIYSFELKDLNAEEAPKEDIVLEFENGAKVRVKGDDSHEFDGVVTSPGPFKRGEPQKFFVKSYMGEFVYRADQLTAQKEPAAETLKDGDDVVFTPTSKRDSVVKGKLVEIIKNTNDEPGYHILAPLPGDPGRIVRVWKSNGSIEKVAPEAAPPPAADEARAQVLKDRLKKKFKGLEAAKPKNRLQQLHSAAQERALTLDEQAERDTLERAEGQGFMDFAAPITPGEVAAKKEADIKAKAKAAIEFRLNRKLVGGNIETQTDAFGPQEGETMSLFAEAPTAGATDRQQKLAAAAWKAKGVESSYFKKWQGKAELYRIGDDLISAENGKPVVVEGFHGTTHNFTVVDPSKANVENDMGKGFYVTNTPEDVQENYAGEGPDLTNRLEQKAEQLDREVDGMEPEEMVEQFGISEYDASVLVDTEPYSYGSPQAERRTKILKKIARKELTQHGGATMKVFVKLENPLKLGENEPYWDSEWETDKDGELVGEPTGKMIDFLQAIRDEARGTVDLSALDDVATDGMKAGKAIAEAKKALGGSEDDNGDLNGNEIIRTAIERMGYDGILDGTVDEKFGYKKGLGKPMKGVGPSTVHVIAFKPEQVKSATGNRGTFTKGSRSMLEAEAPHPFYSALTKTVQSIPQLQMTVQQARAAIEKGAKKDEIAMSGIFTDPLSPLSPAQSAVDDAIQFIKASGKSSDPVDDYGYKAPADYIELAKTLGFKPQPDNRKVTKAELTGYALERQATVQDVVLGKTVTPAEQEQYQQMNDKVAEINTAITEATDGEITVRDLVSGSRHPTELNDKARDLWNERGDLLSRRQDMMEEAQKSAPTHFGSYQLPGADEGSYREMFVTWPEGPSAMEQKKARVEFLEKKLRTGMSEAEYEERNKLIAGHPFEGKISQNWNDGHSQYSDIANPIVRIRRNLRTDADGKRTYFIEEMQGPGKSEQEKMPPELRKRIYKIGMKRALRDAVDEGADAIAWTTGEQQAERYSLSKQVDEVSVSRGGALGKWEVWATKDGRQVVSKTVETLQEVDGLIGKELAEKVSDMKPGDFQRRFSGVDLKVGGEGLKRVYDQILPAIANDLAKELGVKKFGVKAGRAEIATPKNAKRVDDLSDAELLGELHRNGDTATVHSLPIPEALKTQQRTQGSALFAEAPSQKVFDQSDTLSSAKFYAGLTNPKIRSGLTEDPKESVARHNAKAEALNKLDDEEMLTEDARDAVDSWRASDVESYLWDAGEKRTIAEMERDHEDDTEKEEWGVSKPLFDWVKAAHPETEDIRTTGYVLPEGEKLSFSHDGRSRDQDHREIDWPRKGEDSSSGTGKMIAMMNAGAMRIDANSGNISLRRPPTGAQEKAIMEVADHAGEAHIDAEIAALDGYGEKERDSWSVGPEDVADAIKQIRSFYRTGKARTSLFAEAPEKQKQLEFAGEMFTDAVQLGAHYIQTGSHRFTEWAEKMREDCGPKIEKYLKSIYETAKVTIESPRGESVEGRPPGLERGLRPPTERIVTARAEHTQHADESVIPDELKPHLDEHQRQGAAAGIASMEKIGGFLNADGTGAGKTRQALTVASHFAKQGKRVVIVTKAETIKQDWKKNTFGGSYGFDSKAMGIPLDLVRDGNVKPGKIGITTYQNLSDVDRNSGPDTVLIFDEAHALKNDSQQAKYGMSATQKASKVMFMSATPADKAEHIYYLAGIGIMEGKTVQKALEDLGMKLVTVKKRDKNGRPYEVKFWAPDGRISDTARNARFSALFNRMTAKGAMIKREISMEGVHVNMLRVSLPPEGHDVQQDILRHFDATHIDDLQGLKRAIVLGHMRRQQEPFKIASTVMLAQRELEQGRQVVIFVSRVNASEVGKWVKGLDGERYRDILMSSEGTAKTMAEAMRDAGIHDIAEIHGNADQNSLEAMADFQSGKKRVVIATIESGGTGINLDDILGNRPRSMIIVTAPFDAVGNVQAAGRIWRLKTMSGANLFYLFGNTDVDEWNKDIIGSKMAMLGAVVEGQVRKLDVSDPEQVSLDDFHSSVAPVSNEGSPRGEMPEGNAFPTLDWRPFKTKAGKDKFVADATPEFWKWWKANGERNNSEGVSLNKWDGKWQVWSDREIGSTELSAAAPERKATDAVAAGAKGREETKEDRKAAQAATFATKPPGVASQIWDAIKTAGSATKRWWGEMPAYDTIDKAIGQWLGAGDSAPLKGTDIVIPGRQKAAHESRKLVETIVKQFPNVLTRQAISRYMEADGDRTTLQKWADKSKPEMKTVYARALNLNAAEKAMANTAKTFFKEKGEEAQKLGLLGNLLENYVTHFVEKAPANQRSGLMARILGDLASDTPASKLKTKFDHAIKRVFASMFDLEQEGHSLRGGGDIAGTLGAYAQAANNTVADRVFVKSLTDIMARDGRPMAVPSGAITRTDGSADSPLLIKPHTHPADTSDYRPISHPALRKWKWLGKEGEKDVLVEGELLIHPDLYKRLKNTLGTSALNNVPIIKAVGEFQAIVKQLMLSFSPFHFVQEGTHAIGHKVNPFKVTEIDMDDPATRELVNAGLMLANWNAKAEFGEGLTANGMEKLLSHIGLGKLGKLNDTMSSFLFEKYIPGLKIAMAKEAMVRNMELFKKELASGKMTREQVAQKTAQQANDAFGEQNNLYAGNNPTRLHVERLLFLAPDFLKSRAKFFADAFRKHGGEQRNALILLAVVLAVTAKLLERMLTGKNDWEKPFSVVTDDREYELRSVPGDVIAMLKNTRQFVMGRISPLISRTALEAATGRDWRGQQRSGAQQVKDLAMAPLPLALRGVIDPEAPDISMKESLISSSGLRTIRHSEITKVRKLGREWQKANGSEHVDEVHPPSKYVGIKNALEDGDNARAMKEYGKLLATMPKDKADTGFRSSLMKPFSGSLANEKAFVASLDADDRATYQAAMTKRGRMLAAFTRMSATTRAPANAPRAAAKAAPIGSRNLTVKEFFR